MAYQITLTLQDVSIVNIRAEAAAISAITNHLQAAQAQSLPLETGTAEHSADALVVCISPDHWLLVSTQMDQEQSRIGMLNQELNAYHGNATLVTDQYSCFKIGGTDVREVLCQGCSIDLDPESFHYGHAAACAFTRSKIVLVPLEQADQYLVLIESSLAEYFEEWVESASGNK